MHIQTQTFKSRFGEFILGSFGEQLCLLDFRYRKMRTAIDKRLQAGLKAEYSEQDNEVLAATRNQLEEYFSGERKTFTIPLLTIGSEFQKSVWQALLKIPFGETASYLELAESIDKPSAVRAVASANGANAISIMIPCHRIIGSNGKLVGYAGGLPTKSKLLRLEQPRLI
ncbi:MAG: methylated-DNA--[protein]-cysteine S-methyltransferase [Xanthomonadales bacterium]|nr:methylated-DNA--[protein]-cysteine S-methyltransferase [Xanthomonadales bacterium]